MVKFSVSFEEVTSGINIMDIGNRVMLVGVSNVENVPFYYMYKPEDKYDCRNVYGETPITKAYWEMVSVGASNIKCISIPDYSDTSIDNLISFIDQHEFDILVMPELYSSNYSALKKLDEYIDLSNTFGLSFIVVLSAEEKNLWNYDEYVSRIKEHNIVMQNYLNNNKYFNIVAGDIIYNKDTKFEYSTNATALYGGILSTLKPNINTTRYPVNYIKLGFEFTEEHQSDLLSAGCIPIIKTINKNECISKGITLYGNTIYNVSHIRIVNTINQALTKIFNKQIGYAMNSINAHSIVTTVLDYYKSQKYFVGYNYKIINSDNTITVDLTIKPNDIVRDINASMNIKLNRK